MCRSEWMRWTLLLFWLIWGGEGGLILRKEDPCSAESPWEGLQVYIRHNKKLNKCPFSSKQAPPTFIIQVLHKYLGGGGEEGEVCYSPSLLYHWHEKKHYEDSGTGTLVSVTIMSWKYFYLTSFSYCVTGIHLGIQILKKNTKITSILPYKVTFGPIHCILWNQAWPSYNIFLLLLGDLVTCSDVR